MSKAKHDLRELFYVVRRNRHDGEFIGRLLTRAITLEEALHEKRANR